MQAALEQLSLKKTQQLHHLKPQLFQAMRLSLRLNTREKASSSLTCLSR